VHAALKKRRITPAVYTTALEATRAAPPGHPTLLRIMIDALAAGHARLELGPGTSQR
jgi:hypothetical protein